MTLAIRLYLLSSDAGCMAMTEDKDGSAVMPSHPLISVGKVGASVVAAAAGDISWAITLPTIARKRTENLMLNVIKSVYGST